MSSAPQILPSPEGERELHRRLMEQDPTAPADLARSFVEALINWLQSKNKRQITDDLFAEAAGDAIVALIKNPTSYQADRGKGLFAYLCMSAQGDLQNSLRRERNQVRAHAPLDSLELSSDRGKYLGQVDHQLLRLENSEELQHADETVLTQVRDGLTPGEVAALDLMNNGERKTAEFVRVLRIDHLSKAEQRKAVKRVKDKLKSRIKRERSEHDESS
jgi:hypothetical protein